MSKPTEISRFYLKADKSQHMKRLINLMVIRDSSGKLFEFKITFEGIKGLNDWIYMENAVADSLYGIRDVKRTRPLNGNLSVGYHADGNVMYKLAKNMRPEKYPPVSEIAKPEFFLRISGFCLDNLHHVNGGKKPNEQIITLAGFSNKTLMTCDFYVSNHKWGVSPGNEAVFKGTQVFAFHDSGTGLALNVHFYKTDKPEFYIVVPSRKILKKISRYFTYFWYRFVQPANALRKPVNLS